MESVLKSKTTLVSVVIPAYNEALLIRNTIKKIKAAIGEVVAWEERYEILVCDNNSTDDTRQIALAEGARVVFEPVNHIAKARNAGAGEARGEWLMFIDADSYPTPCLMNQLYSKIQDGRCIGYGSTIEVENGTAFNRMRLERLNPVFRLLNLCGGAFLVCQKETWQDIGGFDESLYAYEDVDFVIKLKKYGRVMGREFELLSNHPVVTSGRKGEYSLKAIITLVVSNVWAPFVFLMSMVVPRSIIKRTGVRMLGYWYKGR